MDFYRQPLTSFICHYTLLGYFNIKIYRETRRIRRLDLEAAGNVNVNGAQRGLNIVRHNKEAVPLVGGGLIALNGIVMGTLILSFKDQIGTDLIQSLDMFVFMILFPTFVFASNTDLRRHALDFFGLA